jgi:hypothetical protein
MLYLRLSAVEHLRTLLNLVLTNSEARKLLSDAGLIGRDLFARGAVRAAEKVRPDQERLAQVDEAGPSDAWRNNESGAQGPNTSAPPVVPEDQQARAQDTLAQGQELADRAQTEGPQRAQAEAQAIKSEIQSAPEGEQTEQAKRSLKDRLLGVRDRIPEEHRDQAHEQYDKGVQFFKDEFPEERRDQFIYRLKKVSTITITLIQLPHQIYSIGRRRMPETSRLSTSSYLVPRIYRDLFQPWQDSCWRALEQGWRIHF